MSNAFNMNDIFERYHKEPVSWIEKIVQDDESTKWKKILEEKTLAYENGKMLSDDSEVEIGVFRGEVWICDYNRLTNNAEFIEMVCTTEKITMDDINDLCVKHNW